MTGEKQHPLGDDHIPVSSRHAHSLPPTCFDQWDLGRGGAGHFQAESIKADTWLFFSPSS